MVKNDRLFQLISNIVFVLLCALCLLPFILLVVSSFTDEMVLIRNGYSFFPEKLSLESYKYLFVNSNALTRGYLISIIVTVAGTALSIAITTLMAYPLSRKDLPHRNIFTFIVFFTMLFNGGLVPSYIMWTQTFQIKNSLGAYIFPGLLLGAYNIIMMRTNISVNIPESVTEAARIDGAGEWRILTQLVVPMSKPIIATLIVMIGLGYWNNWTNGLYYISKDQLFSIQVLLNRMLKDVQYLMSNSSAATAASDSAMIPAAGIRMAVAVMGTIPILMVYPFFHKFFVKGITIGSVKG